VTNCLHPIGKGKNLVTGEEYLMPCKSWLDPVCRMIKKNKLMDEVSLFFAGEEVLSFATFTEQRDSGRSIKKDLIKFRNTLYRGLKVRSKDNGRIWIVKWKPMPRCKAFVIFEFHKSGVLHCHMIVNFDMSLEEFTQRWFHATKGVSWQVHIERSDNVMSAAGYMMKYMAKQFESDDEWFEEGGFQFGKWERRYSFWKDDTVKSVPKQEWKEKPEGAVEVELDSRWNPQSKYWVDYAKVERSPGIRLKLEVKDDEYGLPDEVVDVWMYRGHGGEWVNDGWYNARQKRWGKPFIDYMNYMLCGFLTKWRIDEEQGWHYKTYVDRGCRVGSSKGGPVTFKDGTTLRDRLLEELIR